MKWTASKTISQTKVQRPVACRVSTIAVITCSLLVSAYSANAATVDTTLCIREIAKPMSDGVQVKFWGYTLVPAPTATIPAPTCSDTGDAQIPGPPVEVGIGETLNLTLSIPMGMPMPPMEPAPYMGHTIHMHGADVPSEYDGVPETSTAVGGMPPNPSSYKYIWTPTDKMAGTYMYHCHVHTVKHLEMGMYGALIVVPKDAAGNPLSQLTPDIPGKPTLTNYDYIQTYLFSTVDPAYHTAVGDDPVFADYNPKYFLLNGKESIAINSSGATVEVAAATLPAATGKRVALRLIGLHAVNGVFSIRDGLANTAKFIEFTVYVQDGRQYPTPEGGKTSLDIGPGQRFDIIFTTPNTSGTWYPQFEYQTLRDNSPYTNAKVFGSVTF